MSKMWNNSRYALRQLQHSPGCAATVVLALALGVAANAVAFSLLDSLVLRPLRLPSADSLSFFNNVSGEGHEWPSFSYPNYRDFLDRNHSFEGLAAYKVSPVGVGVAGSVDKRWLVEASGNYFDVMGVKPALGRFFHAGDERGPGSAPYAVLDYGFWKNNFNGDTSLPGHV